MSTDQVDCTHDASAFLGFIGQRAFEPCFGPVCEFAAIREHLDWFYPCRRGKVVGQMVRVGSFVTSHTASFLARPRVHPDQLVSDHSPVTVEDLHVNEPVRRDFHVE